jgi:hypothetical protein
MAIILSHPLTIDEIRVLQEYRRISAESLTIAALKAIKHPVGGGEAPVLSLVGKGYLIADEGRENFSLTPKAKEFLAIDYVPADETAPKSSEAEA